MKDKKDKKENKKEEINQSENNVENSKKIKEDKDNKKKISEEEKNKRKQIIINGLIVFLIIIFIIIINISRKVLIINDIDSKILKQIADKNVYVEVNLDSIDSKSCVKSYRKDDITKKIFERTYKDNNENYKKTTQITVPNKHIIYTEEKSEEKDKKTMRTYIDSDNDMFDQNQNIIPNYVATVSEWEKIYNALTLKMNVKKIDGKEYYVVSGTRKDYLVTQGNIKKFEIYIEKDTGLTRKIVIKVKDENNNKNDETETFDYKFNIVTDEDLKELDASQFEKI